MDHDAHIARAVFNHLNAWQDKPCPFRMENLDKAPIAFSVSMQQLTGTVVQKRYIDGSFVGTWPFAVYVRVSGRDTAKHFDAAGVLYALSEWLEQSTPPDIGERRTAEHFQMTGLPAIAASYDDGGVDYQAIFGLTYKQRSV